jgi:hypothetical protein
MKTACVISSAECGLPVKRQRRGMDEVHMPLDEGGKRRLGFVAGVFREQFMVVPFGHLPIRCPRTAKLDKLFHFFSTTSISMDSRPGTDSRRRNCGLCFFSFRFNKSTIL